MRRQRRGGVGDWPALLLLVAAAACRPAAEPEAAPLPPPPDVIAEVNGQAITEHQFQEYLLETRGEAGEAEESDLEIPLAQLFREFLLHRLLLESARRSGLSVEEEEVQDYRQRWLPEDTPPSPAARQTLRDFLLVQKFLRSRIAPQVEVTLGEMQQYYEQHEEEFIVDDRVEVLEILVEDRAQAESLRKQLRAGDGRTFRRLAREFSQGSTAENGGELGVFARGELPEDFEKVVFALRPGEISRVFQSLHGYHIFMVEQRLARHAQKFHEVYEEIFQRLAEEKERKAVEDYLNQLLQDASIQIYREDLRWESEKSNASHENG